MQSKVLSIFITLIISLITIPAVAMPYAAENDKKSVSDEILIKYRSGTKESEKENIHRTQALSKVEELKQLQIQKIRVPAHARARVLEALNKNPFVEFAEPNYLAEGTLIPNDPLYTNQYGPQKIQAPQAWDITTGNSSIIIAVVDTGVDMNHPDLQGKVIAGYDFANGDADPTDDQGHGTHVAGIIGAIGNNNIGVAGVIWQNKILAVKVLNSTNTGSYSAIANGIIYAADNGAKIINLSLGGTADGITLKNAINYATNKGVIVVAAAGNNGTNTPFYPAYYENVIAVGATDSTDKLWSNSNYGSWVDVVAPGSSIRSTYWTATSGSIYASMTGTSMAAPHVSGVTGLLLSHDITRTPTTIRALIEQSTDDIGVTGKDTCFANGRINAYKAVTKVSSTLNFGPTPVSANSNCIIPTSTQSQPTVKITNIPTPTIIPGDLNTDGIVNNADLILCITNYAKSLTFIGNNDINGDQKVNMLDTIFILLFQDKE